MCPAVLCESVHAVCIKKIFLKPAINGKSIKSSHSRLGQTEFVKYFSYKKFVCEIPDICDL